MAEYKQHQIQMAAEDIENVLQTSAKLVTNSDTKLTEEEKELIKNNLDISELNGLSSLEIGEYAKVEENSAFENEAYNAFAQGSKRDKSGAPEGTSRDTQAFAPSSMAAGMGAIAYSRASKSMGYRTQTGTPLSEEEYNRHYYTDENGNQKNDIIRATDDKGNILYQNVNAEKPLDDNYNIGQAAAAFGSDTAAVANNAFAQGNKTQALGQNSHAEGNTTVASGKAAHSEGYRTEASGENSHAEGRFTVANKFNQHVQGRFNVIDTTTEGYAHIVGNGTAENARSNAHTLDWDGNAWFKGGVYVGGTSSDSSGSSKLVTTAELNSAKASHYVTAGRLSGSTVGGRTTAEGYNTTASVANAHAEGNATTASGTASHAEGYKATASGGNAHAEGDNTIASGAASHAEGSEAQATASYAHAEGRKTYAQGQDAHSEGNGTYAIGAHSHAQGASTRAEGDDSHAEGRGSYAKGTRSHAEGFFTIANEYQHVQGKYNEDLPSSTYAHIVGGGSGEADRKNIHTLTWTGDAWYAGAIEGQGATINGAATIKGATTINGATTIKGATTIDNSLTVKGKLISGTETTATGTNAIAQGKKTTASGTNSHAEGGNLKYNGEEYGTKSFSFVDSDGVNQTITVNGSKAYGIQSHAEGSQTLAYGLNSHAEGHGALASGHESHAEGHQCQATGLHSHAEGHLTVAAGINSHAQGSGTVANGRGQSVWGYYNIPDTYTDDDGYGKYIHIVGNGRYEWDRPSNAHTLDWSGNAWFAGNMECNALILKSPNGTRYKITVSDDGKLNTPVKL